MYEMRVRFAGGVRFVPRSAGGALPAGVCTMGPMVIRWKSVPRWLRIALSVLFALLVVHTGLVVAFRPSHDREWELGQERLPHITLAGDVLTIENFRNFDWHGTSTADARYETRSFPFSAMQSVDVFISHFDDFEGLAHIFLSFGFSDGSHAVVSFETRREKGEKFSPTLGLLRQFEVVYVVGSEEDIVGLRTDLRNERVYLYPTKATPAQAQALFMLLADDINTIFAHPRMYNTLTHNCTNALTRRVEDMSTVDFPLTWKTLLPGYFDEVLYELALVQHDTDFATVKENHRVDNAAVDRHSPTFGRDIRNGFAR